MASSLICSETQSRVSSVLNRDVKQYGKKFMFDCNEETCWNSDQGESQWVSLEFPRPVKVSEIKVQFQGGFSAKTCRLDVSDNIFPARAYIINATVILFLTPHPQLSHKGGPRSGQSKNKV
uniref:Nuclear receptor 2C2-associated protein n=1 Tax=Gasterosteus aculeatus aculeatus TaxID=481459 RepID=A0AAQ4NWH8_GASAC